MVGIGIRREETRPLRPQFGSALSTNRLRLRLHHSGSYAGRKTGDHLQGFGWPVGVRYRPPDRHCGGPHTGGAGGSHGQFMGGPGARPAVGRCGPAALWRPAHRLGPRGGEVAGMKVLVATSGVPFIRGGAEILADNLCQALSAAGHAAELIFIPFKHYPPNRIPGHMLACRLLDLTETCGVRIDRVIALKFPAYLIPHPNKVIWLLHQHRTAYELWDHPTAGDLIHHADGPVVREAIRQADRELIPEAKAVHVIRKCIGPPAPVL